MKKTSYKTFKVTCSLVIILIAIFVSSFQASSSSNFSENDLWKYKTWTKVNKNPMRIDDIVAQLCAPIVPVNKSKEKNLHRDKFITVYVNDLGKNAMFAKTPKFPVGSVIVKEKLPSPTDKAELMTVMIKREKGFNPENGDWEYLVLDPVKTSILERGKLERCQACHLEKKGTDFIFRTYYYNNTL